MCDRQAIDARHQRRLMPSQSPSIVVIDNHDSFVHTIVGYLRFLEARVQIFRNDEAGIETALDSADGVLVSPGPGTPRNAGATMDVIAWCADRARPMLGVCLGHQALAEHFGGQIDYAQRIMHGRTSEIDHDGRALFDGLPQPLTVTRYHSLVVAAQSVPPVLRVTAWTRPNGAEPEPVVMALEHKDAPLASVQFHPEAVMTEGGHQLLDNWLTTLRSSR